MSNPFVGEIRIWALNFAPKGWAFCNGQTMPINTNQALFSLIGTQFGGNGTTNFLLPDLRGRTPYGATNNNTGIGIGIGIAGGVEAVTLNATQIPPHIHTMMGTTTAANGRNPGGYFAADTSATSDFYSTANSLIAISPNTVATAGGNQPHDNMQPYLVLNYCIALQGIFPSRN